VTRLPSEQRRSCDEEMTLEERLGGNLERSALRYPVKWAMTVKILEMDDTRPKEWFGLAWDMFLCPPAVPRVSLVGLYPFECMVEVVGGVKLQDVVRALRDIVSWCHGGWDLRMTEKREKELDDRLSRWTLRPCAFTRLMEDETRHLLNIAAKVPFSDPMEGVHIDLPTSWGKEDYRVKILGQVKPIFTFDANNLAS